MGGRAIGGGRSRGGGFGGGGFGGGGFGGGGFGDRRGQSTPSFGSPRARNNNVLVLAVGDRVNHDKYGLGTVLESTGSGTSAMVLVDFGTSGRVKMMLIGGVPMTKL